ncbi:hypothetical protein LDENG_00116320 [Lucifuga dentata]|nr:hypothetical protein LDENG_00116320 [Lucifuga dentata]
MRGSHVSGLLFLMSHFLSTVGDAAGWRCKTKHVVGAAFDRYQIRAQSDGGRTGGNTASVPDSQQGSAADSTELSAVMV